MEKGFAQIQTRLPFPIIETLCDPDNGSEFLNHHLLQYFHGTIKDISLARSRPYQKNDNRFVEQKNHPLVRGFFGDLRFDTLVHRRLLNTLYEKMWLSYNSFQPVLRLKEKERIETAGGLHFYRKWDKRRLPWAVCARPRYWMQRAKQSYARFVIQRIRASCALKSIKSGPSSLISRSPNVLKTVG